MKKPLIETNPYLRDPVQREILLDIAVRSSTAIEGVQVLLPRYDTRRKVPRKARLVARASRKRLAELKRKR